ncbi:F-box domain protein [Aspergillus aurantiobrunneus]
MEKLPVEILTKIIDYLTPSEQVQLQSVSKRLFAVARDNNLWRLHSYENTWAALSAAYPRNEASASLVSNPTASLSSLGQPSLRSLIQPQPSNVNSDDPGQAPTFGERARAAAAWDPSAEGEDVDWYSEYIARNGPVSLSWLQQPYSRTRGGGKEYIEVKGMGLLNDWSLARQNKVVSPLSDGSICVWDLNHSHSIGSRVTKGSILGTSAPGVLTTDMSQRKENSATKSALEFLNLGECVSVDSIRQRAYLAVGNVVNEVDLQTLGVISQQRYPWSVFALSQETDYSVPLTLATTLSLHIYDGRLSKAEEEETINLRCEQPTVSLVPESLICTPPDSPLLQLQPNGKPPHRIRSPGLSENSENYAPLFQPGPLAVLHPPAPHVNSIFLAGRFPSILQYDRRNFPKLQSTVHSGGRLCGLVSVPAPQFPVFSSSNYPASHTVVACGEYNGKGSLEMYHLTPSGEIDGNGPSTFSSSLTTVYQNRQSAARSKILSAQSHGTRIVYSDGDGNIKWVERDGRTEVRRLNINSYRPPAGTIFNPDTHSQSPNGDEAHDVSGLWASVSRAQSEGDVARKVLPTGGNLTGDELLVWTGDRLGRIRFSDKPDSDEIGDDDEMSLDGDLDEVTREEVRLRKRDLQAREREYSKMMRKALERQADEVRRMGDFGL